VRNLFVLLNKVILATLLLTVCLSSSAEEVADLLVLPESTNLKLIKVESDHLEARFSDRIWISGVFVAQWVGEPQDANDENYASLDYVIVPDSISLTKLPYFKGYQPQVLSLVNAKDALRMVAGKAKAKQLLQHKINKVRVQGRFLLGSYIVGVECDSPWASVNLIRFEIPSHLAALHEIPDGC
jgi:hypothetical protein